MEEDAGELGDQKEVDRVNKEREAPSSQIVGFDGLKAIAIIGITLFHMFPHLFRGGFFGVSLFFLLTGYLLAYTSVRNWNKRQYSTVHYFIKRFKRIYPPLLIVILTTIGVYSFLLPNSIIAIRPEVISIILGYNNWWQIHQNADYFTRLVNASPFTHLWFMGIELQYFVLWPILFFIYSRCHKKWGYKWGVAVVTFIGLCSSMLMPYVYVPGQDVTRLYYGTDTRIYALLFGASLGLIRGNRVNYEILPSWQRFFCVGIFILLFVGLIVVTFVVDGQNPVVYEGGMLAITIGFCIMVWLTENNTLPIGKALDFPPLRWIGHHSYGIFLWQYPVLFLFQRMQWNTMIGNVFTYNALVIVTIVLLTYWTDEVVKGANLLRKPILLSLTVLGSIFMLYGVIGIVNSSDQKVNDLGDLQSRLEANAAIQQAENEKAAMKAAEEKEAVEKSLHGVACIGDSVMLGSASALRTVLPGAYIDAKVSRYVGGGLDVAKDMESKGRLGKVVLVGLGTNGPITGYYEDETKALLKYLGKDRDIFWVNVYGPDLEWQNGNNQYLEKIARENSNVTIIDWYSLVSKHKEWLSDDGVHPNDKGVIEYAKLVHDTMEKRLSEKEKNK